MNAKEASRNVLVYKSFDKKDFHFLEKYSSICILTDDNTHEHCYPLIKDILPAHHITLTITPGEEYKILNTCTLIWQFLTENKFDRKSIVVNLGGGVIGDMGGFCASTYKRGIDFVQMPTTLLAQVDASVGGKLGIDFNGFKNHIGVFKMPRKVMIYPSFIKTLTKRELISGYAEVIKHALIRDVIHWDILKRVNEIDTLDWHQIIHHSIEIKSFVVEEDPFEKGLRKILNFGHTIGHAIESYFLENKENKLLHGEAIAIGMICEAYISYLKGFINEATFNEIKSYLLKVYKPVEITADDIEKILPLTLQDKKNTKGVISASLLATTGKANFDQPISLEEVKDSLEKYTSYQVKIG